MRMRTIWVVLAVVACGGGGADEPTDEPTDAPCGTDDDDDALPACEYVDVDGEVVTYCEGDQWPASDGCNSCGCDADGQVFCTEIGCR